MNRVGQILELLRAERRDVEAGVHKSFDAQLSMQLDKLIAAEDLIREYQAAK